MPLMIAFPLQDGTTPLHSACYSGSLELVQWLIGTMRFDPAVRDDVGETPLMYATKGGHQAIVEWLIKECRVEVDAECNVSLSIDSG